MTTLAEAVERAKDAFDRYTNFENTATEAEDLHEFNQHIASDLLPGLKKTLTSVRAFDRQSHISVAVDISVATTSVDALTAQSSGPQASAARRRATNALADLSTRLKSATESAWNQYLSDRLPDVAGFAQLAETLRAVGVNAEELTTVVRSAVGLARVQPTEDDLKLVDSLRARLQTALSQATAGEPEVQAFLAQLASGGATLTAVTERVRQWMQKLGIDDQFRVVVTRNR